MSFKSDYMEKNMNSTKQKLLADTIASANVSVAKCLLVFAVVTFIVWFLNFIGFFLLGSSDFSIITISTFCFCSLPYIILKCSKSADKACFKYLFMGITLIVTFILYTPLSFHTIILLMLPLTLSLLYFDRAIIIFTTVGSILLIIFGTILSFYFNITPDAPLMDSIQSLVFYAVIPRILIFMAMAIISLSISSKASALLNKLILAANSIKIKDNQSKIISSLANLVESKDGDTGQHVKRTSYYVEILANAIKNKEKYASICTDEYIENLVLASPLHDIGKIAISDSILCKPGKLTPEEFEIMKTHTTIGGETILKCMDGIEDDLFLNIARDVALYHHEKWNGSGYPTGLSYEQIPLSARIMAVADVFDALTQKRCYKDAYPAEKAFEILIRDSGTHFDPDLVEAFLSLRPVITEYLLNNKD